MSAKNSAKTASVRKKTAINKRLSLWEWEFYLTKIQRNPAPDNFRNPNGIPSKITFQA